MDECDRYLDSKELTDEISSTQSNGSVDPTEPTLPEDAGLEPQHIAYPGPPPDFRAFLHNDISGLGLFYPLRPARHLTLDGISTEFINDDVSQSHISAFRRMYEEVLIEMHMTPSDLQRFMDVYVQYLRDFLIKRRAFPIEAEHEWRRTQVRMQQRILQWTKEKVNWMKQHTHIQVRGMRL